MDRLHYFVLISKILKKYVNKIIVFDNDQYYINVEVIRIFECVALLKSTLLFKLQTLVDITAIDWIWRLDRYSVYYNFISYHYNIRLFFIIDIPVFFNYVFGIGVESLTKIFPAANWLEREVWDMFGIYFFNHPDLRRILTDYGFNGFPFRKDFPLMGYLEVRYDEHNKLIISEALKISQDFRVFAFINPWIKPI